MKNKPSKHVQTQFSLGLLLGLLITSGIQAQIALPLYEPFNYGNNERIGTAASSITNWRKTNGTGA